MKAVICHDTKLSVAEVEDPKPGKGQILIEVQRTGICGSDLHARTHSDDLADLADDLGLGTLMRSDKTVVMGHEFTGTVLEYGPGTRKSWKTGTPLVALPIVRVGDEIHMSGYSEKVPGGYSERLLVQESMALSVPNGLAPEIAAMTEPLAVAWHAVRRGSVGKGQPAVVIGCGPIGLAVILMLKAAGVRTVIASDFSPGRRALAKKCGADIVVDPSKESPWDSVKVAKEIDTLSSYLNFGIDTMGKLRMVPVPKFPWQQAFRIAEKIGAVPSGPVIFECVGVPGIINQIILNAPLHSRVVVVGVCMETDSIRPVMAIYKELDIRFAFGYDPGEFHDTLHMLSEGKVDPRPLITGTVGLGGVEAAFSALGDPEVHAKILIDPKSSALTP